jgi:hypothetical protein
MNTKNALLAGTSRRIVTPYRPKVESPDQARGYMAARRAGQSHSAALLRATQAISSGMAAVTEATVKATNAVSDLSQVMRLSKVSEAMARAAGKR